jgi:predicted dehydrogenase
MGSKTSEISRREFLAKTAQTTAGVVAATTLAGCVTQKGPVFATRVLGANERINMAAIGIRGRGLGHVKTFSGMKNVQLKTLCDTDENLYASRIKVAKEAGGVEPGTEYDMRRVFDDKEIDAVCSATPNHWHSLLTIWACQAGKHVFIEKPASHNVWEGRKMIEAACKYNRIVQIGFQNRSSSNVIQAIKLMKSGYLGEIVMTRGLCYKKRDDIGRYPDGPVPKGMGFGMTVGKKRTLMWDKDYLDKVHYDLWIGPAPKRPFNRNRFHYNWHWNWDYGNGDIGNQGVHQMDVARWALGVEKHPVEISSTGGYLAYDSDQQTPNTQTTTFKYCCGKVLQFEVRGLLTNDEAGVKVGNIFYGTKGYLALSASGDQWATYMGPDAEPGEKSGGAAEVADPTNLAGTAGANFGRFINAVRTGNKKDIDADVKGGHLSSALCHLANISYRVGRTLKFDGAAEKCVGDGEANRMLKGFPQEAKNGKIVAKGYRNPYAIPNRV